PCREVRIPKPEESAPAILSVKECETLLRTAEARKQGRVVPYLVAAMFGGLRPSEISRLTWDGVNLAAKEIRLEGIQTKTGKPRVVAICDTLLAWLRRYKGKPFFSHNWRRDFDAVKASIGYGRDLKPWPVDVLRHTAISHYFRETGSYGLTSEQ